MRLRVLIKPGAKNKQEQVIIGEVWQVIVREPATDGRANARAAEVLAKHFGVAKTMVRLVNGAASRYKTFEIDA